MGVGQPHQVEHPLHRAIFARHAVERVEHDIGLGLGETQRNIAAHIDPGDAVTLASSASATPVPLDSETSRSFAQPPIRTATWSSSSVTAAPPAGFPIRG